MEYDPVTDTYSMTEEQAFALANPDGGVYIPGAFVLALGTLKAEPRITEAFRTGAGMGWHEHDQNVFTGCEQFFRPGYIANLIPSWIPALDGVADKLQAGAKVADIGCGLGASAILLAQHYPNARFTGSDYHDQSIEIARKRVVEVNLISVMDLCGLTADLLRAAPAASVINVASVYGIVASRGPMAAYNATKAALINLTRHLAAVWGQDGVRVNALAPGYFPTELTGFLADPAFAQSICDRTLLGRTPQPDELDAPLLFLATDASSYMTGQALVIDGGWTAV